MWNRHVQENEVSLFWKLRQDKARQDKFREEKARQDKAKEGKARQDKGGTEIWHDTTKRQR